MNLANCSICDDLGVLAPNTTHNPSAGAIPCECRMAKRKEWLVRNANIPSRYQDAVLGNYETGWRGCSESQTMAKVFAQKFVDEYLTLSSGQSVLFHGGIGTGKTHLGVGILRGLIEKYGVPCYFFDQTESFEMLKLSYGSDDPRDTKKIIGPSLEAEVLLLDDLGLMKLSDWGMTTVSHILTTRYNRRLTTILTTNYPLTKPEGSTDYTLGERITERLVSRLKQMCTLVEVKGRDFREIIQRSIQHG